MEREIWQSLKDFRMNKLKCIIKEYNFWIKIINNHQNRKQWINLELVFLI
jgi:hypothetical protein